MALEKIEVPLVVSGGIDTKTDRKIVPDSKMLITENVDFSKVGTLKKSKGTTRLTNSTDTSDNLNDVSSSIFSHNNEIVMMGKTGSSDIYSYNEAEDEWKSKAGSVGEKTAVSANIEVKNSLTDYLGTGSSSLWEFPLAGFRIVATVGTRSDVSSPLRITKVDYSTGLEQVFEPYSDYNSYEVRVIGKDDATNPIFWVIFSQVGANVSGNDDRVVIMTFDKDVSAVGSTHIVAVESTATVNHPIFDAIIVDGSLFYVAAVITTELKMGYVSDAGSLSGTSTYTVSSSVYIYSGTGSAAEYFEHPNISAFESNGKIYVAFLNNNASKDAYMVAFGKSNLSSVDRTETLIAQGSTYSSVFYRVDLITTPIQSDSDSLILTLSGKDSSNDGFIKTNIIAVDWASSPPTIVNKTSSGAIANAEIVSKAFSFFWPTEENVFYYVMTSTCFNSNISTFVLVKIIVNGTNDWDRVIIGKFHETIANDVFNEYSPYIGARLITSMTMLNPIVLSEDGNYYFPCIIKASLLAVYDDASVFVTSNSIASINLRDSSNFIVPTRLSQSTHLSGSVVKEYDGGTLRYSGFQTIPKIILTVNGSFTIDNGLHQYKAIFVYLDNNGEIHRSGQSSTGEITTASQAVNVTLDPESIKMLNQEVDGRAEVWIYRAVVGTSGPFYLVGRIGSGTVVYVDIEGDSEIISNQAIYTNGGVLENSQVPAMSYIASGLNRIFGISNNDKNKIYYSQKRIVEDSIEWSEALYFRVDGHGKNAADAVGVENLDDKIIILKEDSILYVSGDGPLPTGAQNTFSEPVVVSQETGCNEVKSIIATPIGVMFKGKKGIYIVDRALAVKYIGAPVEQYNSETITGAEVSKTKNEVYFQTSSRLMIYNYLQNKWSTNTYLGGKSICVWKDQLACVKSDGYVYYQDESVYTDNLQDISMRVVTPWYKLKGITGYGRLYEVVVLGEYKSDHTLNVRIYYDYDETDYDDYTFTVTSINIYEFSLKPEKQKCQSFKIEVWDTPTGGSGESLELTGISVRVGLKKGFFKLSDSYKG